MSGAYLNVKEDKLEMDDYFGEKIRSGGRSGGATVCLGLLCVILLSVVLALVAQNHVAIASLGQSQTRPDVYENLTLTLMGLEERFNNFSRSVKEASPKNGTCPLGWVEINQDCLYISQRGVSKSWLNSKKDCEVRGGRLVTIKTREKLHLLGMFFSHAWIGLSDRADEDLWKWEDGTRLEVDFWMKGEPNNHGDNEDCAHLTIENGNEGFNDNGCTKAFSYICETAKRIYV